jgi:tryptophan 7-halogenase
LHYHSQHRTEPLWEYCRAMDLPDSLVRKEELFHRTGRIVLSAEELFRDASWFAVLLGQGHQPRDYNPLLDSIAADENLAHLRRVKDDIRQIAARMPDHLAALTAQGCVVKS